MFDITPLERNIRSLNAYDPFKEMEDFEKHFFGRQFPAFKTDIRETDGSYIMEAELPGFSKEDIHAELKGSYLTVHAEHKDSKKEDGKDKYIRRERSYSSYSRSFQLDGIDADKITASYKDGILCLTLPKAEAKVEEGRTLEIQ